MTMKLEEVNFQDLFGHAAGEDEPIEKLVSSFVKPLGCDNFFSEQSKLCFVEARKGMGKSALISVLRDFLVKNEGNKYSDDAGNPPLTIVANKGDFIDDAASLDITDANHATLESFWRKRICFRIILEIGKSINYASSDDEISIVESAEQHGSKERNHISSVLRRFAGMLNIGAKTAGLGIPDSCSSEDGLPDAYMLLKRFQEKNNRKIWLLVDDIDAKFDNTQLEQNLIGAFFSTIRELSANQNKKIPGLMIRATVRADVARSLAELEDEDKYRDYKIEIKWSDSELRTFIEKRVENYQAIQCKNKQGDQILEEVFDSRGFTWNSKKIGIGLALIQLGGRRPRWISELCKRAGEIAKRKRARQKIWFDDVTEAMAEFGKDRVADIKKEHKHQFQDSDKLISAFRSGPPKYTRHTLLKRIEKDYENIKGVSNIPDVLGTKYRSEVRHLLGEYLFLTEFIQGEITTGTSSDWRFFHTDPDLFDSPESRANTIKWTINPVFRQHLRTKKED